ncbi:hypothetical protein ACH4A3_29455 [Streptomyces sp. NPDC018007]
MTVELQGGDAVDGLATASSTSPRAARPAPLPVIDGAGAAGQG